MIFEEYQWYWKCLSKLNSSFSFGTASWSPRSLGWLRPWRAAQFPQCRLHKSAFSTVFRGWRLYGGQSWLCPPFPPGGSTRWFLEHQWGIWRRWRWAWWLCNRSWRGWSWRTNSSQPQENPWSLKIWTLSSPASNNPQWNSWSAQFHHL